MGLDNMKEYLGPNKVFSSMKNIANGIFNGSDISDQYDIYNSDSIDANFTDF